MNSAFTFWFWGMVISLSLALLTYVACKINNKWGRREYNESLDIACGGFLVSSCWCVMSCMMWIFG